MGKHFPTEQRKASRRDPQAKQQGYRRPSKPGRVVAHTGGLSIPFGLSIASTPLRSPWPLQPARLCLHSSPTSRPGFWLSPVPTALCPGHDFLSRPRPWGVLPQESLQLGCTAGTGQVPSLLGQWGSSTGQGAFVLPSSYSLAQFYLKTESRNIIRINKMYYV